jgi:hypothetical protein
MEGLSIINFIVICIIFFAIWRIAIFYGIDSKWIALLVCLYLFLWLTKALI